MRKIDVDRYYGSKDVALSIHQKKLRFILAIQRRRLKGILDQQTKEIGTEDIICDNENKVLHGEYVATFRIKKTKIHAFYIQPY